MEQLGADFEVRPADVAEIEEGVPEVVARENALRKALADARAGELVLGVDTIVALDGTIYGKPAGRVHADATLRALSGRTHDVVSGLALVEDGEVRTTLTETTRVTFRELDDAIVDWYLEAEEWQGRAGGYAIQSRGAALVRGVEGDYLNVVGLPATALLDALLRG